MKKMILCLLMVFGTIPAMADILLSPGEEARARREYERGLARCPKDKPLYDGEKCYSCDELKTLVGRGIVENCERVCPNRHVWYECGPSCILKNQPSSDYTYVQCEGWIKK